MYYSMLGLRSRKKILLNKYVRPFRTKTPLVFLRKMKKACANWDFAFWQTSTIFSQ